MVPVRGIGHGRLMAGVAQDFAFVAMESAAGILLIGLPSNARLAALQTMRAGNRPGLGFWRAALHDPILAGKLEALAERAQLQRPSGLSHAESLCDAIDVGLAQRRLIAVYLPRAPLGPAMAVAGPKQVLPPAAPFATMSPTARIGLLLQRTPAALAPDLARAFRAMVTVEALTGIAAAFAVLLAAQFIGVGEIADAGLAWWAYSQAGFSGVYGLYEALRAVVSAVRATDERAFDQAVPRFAEGLTLVGVSLLTVVITRVARKRAGGSSDAAPAADEPPPKPVARPAARMRLPRSNGHWDGAPGESNWYSENPKVNAVTGGKPVPFKDARPDFSEWSKGEITFEDGELDGTPDDFTKVYQTIQEQQDLPNPTAAKSALSDAGLTPHHLDENTIQLIPTDLHGNIPHIGSASDLRGGP